MAAGAKGHAASLYLLAYYLDASVVGSIGGWFRVSGGCSSVAGTTGALSIMTLQSVRAFLAEHAPDIEILEKSMSTATVMDAAQAHNVEPAQIAKTLSLWLRDEVILLILAGDAKIDNRKYKDQFGTKASMLNAEEVLKWTSHPVGGVCPFGLPRNLRTFADITVKKFDVVIPAAGATNAALRISPGRLIELVKGSWVDVAQSPSGASVL